MNEDSEIDQRIEDEIWSGNLSPIEILGWFFFIVSLLIWLLVTQLSFNIEVYGWFSLIIGSVLIYFGGYKRIKLLRKNT